MEGATIQGISEASKNWEKKEQRNQENGLTPRASRKDHSLADTVRPILNFWPPERKIINLCSFKELHVWSFVTVAVGDQ